MPPSQSHIRKIPDDANTFSINYMWEREQEGVAVMIQTSVTYLKFDMLQSLPTDVYVFSFTTVSNTVHMLCITGVDDNLAGKKRLT